MIYENKDLVEELRRMCASVWSVDMASACLWRGDVLRDAADRIEELERALAERAAPAAPAEKPAVPTVVCQIALAIDTKGKWCASGISTQKDVWKDNDTILDFVNGGETRYIVEVPIPVPQVPVVRAEAREVRDGQ